MRISTAGKNTCKFKPVQDVSLLEAYNRIIEYYIQMEDCMRNLNIFKEFHIDFALIF